ncbi:hypothetical protein EVAR_56548_1 [Eumeta japonica]|uniref:Uncharacterized protein n=1 Tax=Eumeta variegata TaxID=151549 RepID=A0A4C1ZTW7_EUMVA|nr:hypothetical protein EVAR_56548_1 [Eumeta japonica]
MFKVFKKASAVARERAGRRRAPAGAHKLGTMIHAHGETDFSESKFLAPASLIAATFREIVVNVPRSALRRRGKCPPPRPRRP